MKMNKYHQMKQKLLFTIVASISAFSFFAQNAAPAAAQSFTLQQAIEYAIKNSPSVQGAQIDYESAIAQKKKITGIGLPQVSASAEYRSFERTLFSSLIRNQTELLYNKMFKDAADKPSLKDFLNTINEQNAQSSSPIATVFGSPFTGTLGLTASQILFSSDYIVALQTAKTYLEFSKQGIAVSEMQLKANVSKSYYSVLVSKERLKLLEANISKLKKSRDDLIETNKQGFVEKIDVDRLSVAYSNLLSETEKVKRLIELGESSLKFVMTYDITQPIVLTDSIINIENAQPIVYAKPDYTGRPEYILAQKGQQLNALAYKREQYSILPTAAAYAQFNYTNYNSLISNEYYKSLYWNRQFVIGGTLSIPIFSGGQKYYSQKMAKLKIQKTALDIKSLENVINIETQSTVTIYNNAIIAIKSQKQNLELANEIFRVSQIKYNSGTGSNLEVLNAQTSLRESQTNYTNALYEYYNAKIDYEKATGTLK
jgi:outer membrane protein